MTLAYEYPVVYFYSDDMEERELVKRKGTIRPIRLHGEPYEAFVDAEGYSFHILFGSQCNGNFLCIPDWRTGCELSYFNDVFWNLESINGKNDSFRYENATAIAYAIKELSTIIDR